MIIYMYKIVIGILPNPSFKMHHKERTKNKSEVNFHPSAPGRVKTLRGRSFFSRGLQLYNTLPKECENRKT